MAIDKKMEQAFNEQINKEYYSEYLYMLMKAHFAEMNLNGFVNWMNVQMQEEKAHAEGMYDYVLRRGGHIELYAIDKPELKGSTPVEIFRQILEHEEYVTSRINHVMDVADEVKDRAALSFLNWYIKEQVEEEENVGGVLATLELIGEEQALLSLDKELAQRIFNQPVIE